MGKQKIHLICNAHLDPVWQWQWEEGCSEAISTFRNAVEILEEYNELIFNHNEALLYKWIKELDPDLFDDIKHLVKEKRWFISGGWYLQPDVNLPETESVIRHILYGRKFFKEHFGVEPKVAYNFDSFGHSGGLPQILISSGFKMYVHMRPQSNDLELPSDLYIWEGIDGTRIPAYRISVGLYHSEYDNIEEMINKGVEKALEKKRDVAVFWGIGNHGGGATRKDMDTIRRLIAREKRVEIEHSTTDHLYECLRPHIKNAPVYKGDLQRVFTGCYTSLSRIKRGSAEIAALARQTEAAATAAWLSGESTYPSKQLEEAWLAHLFNDFHDILPGTCIEPAEHDSLDFYGIARQQLRDIRLKTTFSFNKMLPAKRAYLPVTILNTNPVLKRVPVEVECMFSHRPPWKGKWELKVFDSADNELQSQEEQAEALLPFNQWRRKICFFAEMKGTGIVNFFMKPFQLTDKKNNTYKKTTEIVNSGIWIKEKPNNLNSQETGLIEVLKSGNTNILKSPLLNPVAVNDTGDSWGTGCWKYDDILAYFRHNKEKMITIEDGPVRLIEESVFSYKKSFIRYHTIHYRDFDAIEFRLRVHWNEAKTQLRLESGFNFKQPELIVEVPGGSVVRPSDGQEHVQGRWAIIYDKSEAKKPAIGIINNGQSGVSLANGVLSLSVLRSAAYCHEKGFRLEEHRPYRKYMEQGVHNIKLMVISGNLNDVKSRIAAYAEYLNCPPAVYPHLPVGSKNPKDSKTFQLDIDDPVIKLLALKKAESGDGAIIRLQETSGQRVTANLRTSLSESEIKIDLNPHQIKTIYLDKSGTNYHEVNILENNP